nr:MAG TPA: hypothetical protein [Caudoviricetes sp.]
MIIMNRKLLLCIRFTSVHNYIKTCKKKAYQFYWRRIERRMLDKYSTILANLLFLYTNYSI